MFIVLSCCEYCTPAECDVSTEKTEMIRNQPLISRRTWRSAERKPYDLAAINMSLLRSEEVRNFATGC